MKINRFLRGFIIALVTVLLGSSITFLTALEASLGLDALFKIRGLRPPPEEVVVVAMDETSDKYLNLGWELPQWRGFHARLIQELQRQGAALIVFDLQFIAEQPDHDPAFADAIKAAGNVLVTDCIQTQTGARDECSTSNKTPPVQTDGANEEQISETLSPWKLIPPNPLLKSSVLDHAPFVLQNDAENPVIRETWTFLDPLAETPTLPVLTWFYYLQQTGTLPDDIKPEFPLSTWLTKQRRQCLFDIDQPSESLPDKPDLAQRVNKVICPEDSRYLDFYGSSKSLRMESYSDVYEGKVANLKDKVVFVGKANRKGLPGQKDYFQTPFTDTRSGRMAGVEIMATQFANLLEGRFVTPLPPVLILAGFGLVIGLLVSQLAGFSGIAVSIVLCSAYAYFALWCFNRSGLWLPVVVPLLIQLPSAWFMSLYWSRLDQLKEAKQLKEKIEEITAENNRLINQFVDRLQNNETPDLVTEHAAREVFGLCLATDIKGYTSLAESNPSDRLFELLREYFKLLSAAVSSQGGIIANITGDSMLAIWIDLPVAQQQFAACSATLEMGQAIEQFNKLSNLGAFPTRIGLHQGDFTLGSFVLGIPDTTNPVGDTVNTASRIEGVNKQLGTQILASSAIVTELEGVLYRPVGCFRFVGKHEPIELIEIVGMQSESDAANKTFYKQFAKGLKAFRQGHWQVAKAIFQTLHDKYGHDGPTQYYLAKTSAFLENPPQNWEGCINLATK